MAQSQAFMPSANMPKTLACTALFASFYNLCAKSKKGQSPPPLLPFPPPHTQPIEGTPIRWTVRALYALFSIRRFSAFASMGNETLHLKPHAGLAATSSWNMEKRIPVVGPMNTKAPVNSTAAWALRGSRIRTTGLAGRRS